MPHTLIPAAAVYTSSSVPVTIRPYRVGLFAAAMPQGLSGKPLAQGEESTGKLYFDVTGPAPTHVVTTTPCRTGSSGSNAGFSRPRQ